MNERLKEDCSSSHHAQNEKCCLVSIVTASLWSTLFGDQQGALGKTQRWQEHKAFRVQEIDGQIEIVFIHRSHVWPTFATWRSFSALVWCNILTTNEVLKK